MSQDSCDSREREPIFIQASDIRRRLADSFNAPTKSFQRDPEDPSAAALKVKIRQLIYATKLSSLTFDLNNFRNRGKRKWQESENRLRTAIIRIGNYFPPSSSVAMTYGKSCWLTRFFFNCNAFGKRNGFPSGSDLIGKWFNSSSDVIAFF